KGQLAAVTPAHPRVVVRADLQEHGQALLQHLLGELLLEPRVAAQQVGAGVAVLEPIAHLEGAIVRLHLVKAFLLVVCPRQTGHAVFGGRSGWPPIFVAPSGIFASDDFLVCSRIARRASLRIALRGSCRSCSSISRSMSFGSS